MKRRIPRKQTDRARELRNNATPEERRLWRVLNRYRPKCTRQLPVGPFYGDLACREARLIVEIDGSQHADSDADSLRSAFLEGQGWKVIRFWNSEVRENPDGVAQSILQKAAECLGGTHPQPLPSRKGRVRRRRFD